MIDKVLNKAIDIQAAQLDKAKDVVLRAHETYSPRAWIGLGVLLGAIAAALAAGFLQRDFSKRNIEYFPDMGYSEAWESQLTNDYSKKYADSTPELPPAIEKWGTAEMAPPVGTVYRGQQRLEVPAEVPTGDNERLAWARANLSNPYANTGGEDQARVLQRGKNLFRMNCQGCHGVDGVGMAPVTKYGIGAPTLANATVRDKYKDGEIFYIITFGIRTMPAHKNHVKYDDRWKLIRYLRELQKGK
ncbi:MAG: c-type cytochrome [Planctomycetes bacterium]|nr:c-type cytochrome [Planctomycetota bacterium]